MTDNDIIKALEICISGEGNCASCPYLSAQTEDMFCGRMHGIDILDLINRQRAEIAELQHKYDLAVAEREANVKGFTETLEGQRAEIEQYKDYNAKLHEKLCECRAEAVKEFAERLKKEAGYFGRAVAVEDIDRIAKEMVGEQRKEDEGNDSIYL